MLFSKKSRAAKFRGRSAAADRGFIRFSAVLRNGTGDRRIRPSAITETAARCAGGVSLSVPPSVPRGRRRAGLFSRRRFVFFYTYDKIPFKSIRVRAVFEKSVHVPFPRIRALDIKCVFVNHRKVSFAVRRRKEVSAGFGHLYLRHIRVHRDIINSVVGFDPFKRIRYVLPIRMSCISSLQ